MARALFVLAGILAVIWEGGLGGGLLPFGFELMPLVVLTVGGIWYVPSSVYAGGILTAALVIDSMRGFEELPTVKAGLIGVSVMIILQQLYSDTYTPRQVRQLILGVLTVLYVLRLVIAYPLPVRALLVYAIVSALAIVIWWGLLRWGSVAGLDARPGRRAGSAS